ncbi:MAG: dethiobiotin synthase [Gallionellaceae bacterium]|nr:dethiobiotin synthase [Gallionellaceae bacterium]
MNYFITGTDTGVGKTLIACALLHGYATQGQRVIGMKPVAAGWDEDDLNPDVKQLCAASNIAAPVGQINPYSFSLPLAPHIAAHHAGIHIDLAHVIAAYHELAVQADVVIVEGVGGFKVPLNEHEDSADLAVQLGLPVILVVGVRLGCLNHALLTLAAIQASGLRCAGWVANVLESAMPVVAENIAALKQRINAPLLGIVPYQVVPDIQRTALQFISLP